MIQVAIFRKALLFSETLILQRYVFIVEIVHLHNVKHLHKHLQGWDPKFLLCVIDEKSSNLSCFENLIACSNKCR